MADMQNHGFIKRISGRYGKIVVRNRFGRQYLADPPDPNKRVDTPARADVRKRFAKASKWAAAALANPGLRSFYEKVAKANNSSPFAVAARDHLRAPEVDEIGLRGYHGRAGDPITVEAMDDTGVLGVTVTLQAPDGTVLESGPCTMVMGTWTYVTTTARPAAQPVTIVAVATDRPGNTGEKTEVYP
jgi:hypothetical protein